MLVKIFVCVMLDMLLSVLRHFVLSFFWSLVELSWLIVRTSVLVPRSDIMHCHRNQHSNEWQVSKISRVRVSVLVTDGLGNRRFCDLTATVNDVINIEKTYDIGNATFICFLSMCTKTKTDRLHKLRKQLNLAFLV